MSSVSILKAPLLRSSTLESLPSGTQKESEKGQRLSDQPTASEQRSGYFDDTKSLSDFVLIRKDRIAAANVKAAVPDSKENIVLPTTTNQSKFSIPRGLKDGLSRGLKPVRTKLAFQVNVNSGVNTALNAVIPITPSNSSEWGSWSTIYDEVMVHGGQLKFDVATLGTGSLTTGIGLLGAIAFDPVNSGVYTSAAAVIEASQSFLYSIGNDVSTSSNEGGVTAVSKDGLYTFRWKVPKGKPARTTATTTNVSGEYMSTSDASDTVGWLKPYIPAGGANQTIYLFGYIILDVTFRSRS